MIFDKITQKPKGYTFVEYENEKDMHCKFFVLFLILLLYMPAKIVRSRVLKYI